MKLFKKFSLIFLSMLIFICSAVVFAGCGNNDKNYKLYVFSSIGGTVKVDDNDDVVEFGDEGSKIFTYKQNDVVRLNAIPDEGYRFVKWKFTETKQDYSLISTKANIELHIVDKELIIKAEFALDGSITTHDVTYPINPTGYTFSIQNGYSTTVVAGGEFKFKITLWEDYSDSNIVVKANNQVVTADGNGVYAIIVNANTNITVTGVELNSEEPIVPTPTIYRVYTTSPLFNIKFNGQTNIQNSWPVQEGESFTFAIAIAEGYHAVNLVVKANGTVLTSNNGMYTVSSVIGDTAITAEGIVEDSDEPILPNPAIYQVSTTSELFKIVVNGQTNAQNEWNVEEGKSFVFTLQLVDGYKFANVVVVTANGVEVALTNVQTREYTISSIITNTEISVSGIIEDDEMCQVSTTSNLFKIIADGETVAKNSWNVEVGQSFIFTIEIVEGYHAENLVLKADGHQIPVSDGKYVINSVIDDINITANGIVKDDDGPIAPTPMIYKVSTTSELFKIVAAGQTSAKNSWEVQEGESFAFTIQIVAGYYAENLVVKADGCTLTASNGVYTILSVVKDMEITADGIKEDVDEPIIPTPTIYQVSTSSNLFKIVADGQTSAKDSWDVEEGKSFTFTIKIADDYYVKNLVVKTDGYTMTSTNGKYTILSVVKDMEITAEGIIQDVENTYLFALVFKDEIYNQVWLPEEVEITIKDSEKQATYNSNDFVLIDEFDDTYSIKDIIQIVEESCGNLKVAGFTIAGLDFIAVDGDTITVNWNILNIVGSNYELIVKTRAI